MVILRFRIKLSFFLSVFSVFLAFSLIVVIFHLDFFVKKLWNKLQEKSAIETGSLIKAAKGRKSVKEIWVSCRVEWLQIYHWYMNSTYTIHKTFQ